MSKIDVQLKQKSLVVKQGSDLSYEFNYQWLRDNCPTAFHPKTKERNFDLLSVSENIKPVGYNVVNDNLEITWSEQNHHSVYDLKWLIGNAYQKGSDYFLLMPEAKVWDSSINVPETDFNTVISSDEGLFSWLDMVAQYGLSIVNAMPNNEQDKGLEQVAKRIGHLRETNFGVVFNVRSKPNPNNQAYTAEKLPLHTDLPNQETPPGYQFLHCLNNESEGGESTFVDGFKAAEQLKIKYPEYFDLLANNKIPFRFHDESCDIREMRPIISVVDGEVNEIIFNAHIASIFNFAPDLMEDFYLAYRAFIKILNAKENKIKFKLESGQMVVFDNRRVLHGREEFDPQTGARHLRGCYIDRTEFKSKYRLLQQKFAK